MSRYPGSTFVLVDNTNVAAAVPIQTVNPSAPSFLTAFRSVKGPEGIINDISGSTFYDVYGDQSNVLFNKYGQPLLQASMNVNGGAKLISKRAVLDDAHLANATVGLVITKQPNMNIEVVNKTFTFNKTENGTTTTYTKTVPVFVKAEQVEGEAKYTSSTLVYSTSNDIDIDPSVYTETKSIYSEYSAHVIQKSLNISTNELSQITSIVGDSISIRATIDEATTTEDGSSTTYTPTDNENVYTYQLTAEDVTALDGINPVYNGHSSYINNNNNFVSWNSTVAALTLSTTDTDYTTEAEYLADFNKDLFAIYKAIKTASLSYIYPLFTILDNGRGVSTKTISLNFDANTSKTLHKAVYNIKVNNYATDKTLETFSFTVDPTCRNNNTGYTFDIESAVNLKSNQIVAKFHYNTFDALLDTLQECIGCDSSLFVNSDVLFGHTLSGAYPSIPVNTVVNGLRKVVNIYDYSDIKLEGANLYVDVLRNSNNTSDKNATEFKYYFYDYPYRSKLNLSERLEFGSNGMDLSRNMNSAPVDADGNINNKYKKIVVFNRIPDDLSNVKYNDIYNNACQIYIDADIEPNKLNNFKLYDYSNSIIAFEVVEPTEAEPNPTLKQIEFVAGSGTTAETKLYIPKTEEELYNEQYARFFNGDFDKNIFNLDIYFPTACFDANYDNTTKLAIQRLAAYRGDFLAYMDMGIQNVNSYEQAAEIIPTGVEGEDFAGVDKPYVRDMHVAVTCIYYDIRDPYTNRQITVTAPYNLSIAFINHYISGPGKVFAGLNNGITMSSAINGTINYVPKIYPTSAMTSLANIGMTYPSDDETIRNEKQLMSDLRVNYGSYYENTFVMDTEFTMNPTESEFSYINNVLLVCQLMQSIRKSCPSTRYNFIDTDDLEIYEKAVTHVINNYSSSFASVKFRYIQDENSIANKIFYAAIEVVFKPFAQAEIFTITALNYSTLSESVTTV